MASYMLFDSLFRLTEKKPFLNIYEKTWLIETINNELNLEGQEKLYSLLVVYNKLELDIYDPAEPYYNIDKINPRLQTIWFEFVKMHLKMQARQVPRTEDGRPRGSPKVVNK